MRMRTSPDTAAMDWLETFASSIEHDDLLGAWTVRTTEPGYPAGRGRSLRAAAEDAMRQAARADAAGTPRFTPTSPR